MKLEKYIYLAVPIARDCINIAVLPIVLLSSSVAIAANTASASLDWTHYSATFLTGSGTFEFQSTSSMAQAYTWTGGSSNSGPMNVPVSVLDVHGYANAQMNGLDEKVNVSAVSALDNWWAAGVTSNGNAANATANKGGKGVLNAHASIEVIVPYELSFDVNNKIGGRSFRESADVSASMWFSVKDNGIYTMPNTGVHYYSSNDVPSISKNGQLDLIVTNSTDSMQTYTWGAYLTAYAFTQTVSPVPEPETYAMLLAGLGLIGAAVKRHKAKQA
jgi:hypothetical protein